MDTKVWLVITILSLMNIVFANVQANAQSVQSVQNERQKVILEIGAGTWCATCPYSAAAADQLYEEFPEEIAIIEWHYSDIFATEETSIRCLDFYNQLGFPFAYFDGGNLIFGANEPTMYPEYLPVFEEQKEKPSNFWITLSLEETNYLEYELSCTIDLAENILNEDISDDLAAFVVLTESHLPTIPSPIEFEEFNFTARKVYPNIDGLSIDFSAQNSHTFNTTIVLDTNYIAKNCELVVFLQDKNTKEIQQGNSIKMPESTIVSGLFELTELSANDLEQDYYIFPNPSNGTLSIKSRNSIEYSNVVVDIFDCMGNIVHSQKKPNSSEIDVSFLKTGLYFCCIKTAKGISVESLIIE